MILQSCRPDGRDADDPRFGEAWATAAGDAELGARLAEERALDEAVAAKLKSVPVPASLATRVMVDAELRAAGQRRRRATALALAACLALLASLAAAWFARERAAVSFATYRQEMVSRLDTRVQLSFTSESVADLQQWLADKRGVNSAELPAALRGLSGVGCRTWMWNGKPAGLICLRAEGGEVVHLLVVARDAVPRAPDGSSPQFSEVGAWTTASWAGGDHVYLLAGKLDRASLGRLL